MKKPKYLVIVEFYHDLRSLYLYDLCVCVCVCVDELSYLNCIVELSSPIYQCPVTFNGHFAE